MLVRLKLDVKNLLADLIFFMAAAQTLQAAPLPIIKEVEWQPLAAQVRRLIDATEYVGSPLSPREKKALEAALKENDTRVASEKVQSLLDAHCLFGVQINPEMRVKVAQGPARPELMEHGWRQFLVKVENDSGTTA